MLIMLKEIEYNKMAMQGTFYFVWQCFYWVITYGMLPDFKSSLGRNVNSLRNTFQTVVFYHIKLEIKKQDDNALKTLV